MKKVIAMIIVAAIMSGCSWHSRMVNDQGQETNCDAFAFGIIGTIYAKTKYEDCVEALKKKGYKEAGETK